MYRESVNFCEELSPGRRDIQRLGKLLKNIGHMKQLTLLMVTLFIVACNSKHGEGAAPISLNNGEKWEVNAEMRPHIEQGEAILNTYLYAGKTDYQDLAAALKEQNAQLINSCNMKGKSHDELHKWLHPHMELIEELEDAPNLEEANKITTQLTASFAEYKKYFN